MSDVIVALSQCTAVTLFSLPPEVFIIFPEVPIIYPPEVIFVYPGSARCLNRKRKRRGAESETVLFNTSAAGASREASVQVVGGRRATHGRATGARALYNCFRKKVSQRFLTR